ncbi:peptidoglycan-binding protein [Starkeya sp. ORNL1]|uniref:peptidoglycan-binding protein n=1 Tax=Starkeya sp. ORNL1 TaxID=2709380 RepID=UPI001463DC43|nr:peptidoglycan-binding protein [Starkeya sp. ORNL1]QJP14659.1 peptidoglycan-binding protein [Starkeya sp. ORNL1]
MVTITAGQLRTLAPRGRADILDAVARGDAVLAKYAITTPSRLCHFLAQIAHESAGFRTTEEYASGAAYEGRRDLGNVIRGDGIRYKGRGVLQLTGRANYRAYGKRLALDLEGNPEMAAVPAISLQIACEYWKAKGLNALADRDDITGITRKINGGANGLIDRRKYLAKARALWGAAPIETPKSEDEVRELQQDLVALGYELTVDGFDGKKTEAAIRAVQKQAGVLVDGLAGPATKDAIRKRLERRTAGGEPPADKTIIDVLKTPEGMATGGGILTTILGAAANPGPLQWAIAGVVVVALAVGVAYLVRSMRRADA